MAALAAYENTPEEVAGYCKAILRRWKAEIDYQIRNRLRRYDIHLIKALSNPEIRPGARRVAEEMLNVETKQPGYLSASLHDWVKKIMDDEWPSWSTVAEEEETE